MITITRKVYMIILFKTHAYKVLLYNKQQYK